MSDSSPKHHIYHVGGIQNNEHLCNLLLDSKENHLRAPFHFEKNYSTNLKVEALIKEANKIREEISSIEEDLYQTYF